MTADPLAERADSDSPLWTLAKRHGRQDAGRAAIAVVAGAVSTFLSFADVFLIGLGIDALFNDQPFAVPLVPHAWVPTDPLALLAFVTLLLVALNLATNAFAFVDDWLIGVFTQRLLHRTRVETFDAVQSHDLAFFEGERTGDLLSALNDDVNQLDTFFSTILGAAVWITLTVCSALVYMWFLNPQLAVLVLLSAPLVALLNYRFSTRLDSRQRRVRAERGAFNARLETALSGLRVVKAFTAEPTERRRIREGSRNEIDARFDAMRLSVRQPPLNRLVVGAWLVGVTALGIAWVLDGPPLVFSGTLTAGQLVPFLFYLERLTLPMQNLGGVVDHYTSSKAAARRILGTTATTDTDDGGERPLAVTDGRISLEDVTYRYPGRTDPAIDGVSAAIDGGDTVGLVGATGAGKSTLVELLLRFRDPDAGAIRVDGQRLDDTAPASVRDRIGYVRQDPYVFDGTVRENIAYGGDDSSDDRVERAARLAGAHDFIADLPDGYGTHVGAQGASLSGGQRQRLALARALVDDPPILVLDEATSHVDTETERRLQENLADITADRTTLVVAHRLSMVRHADRILVLDDGAVVEAGTHEALLAADGTYARLWRIQTGDVTALD